MSANVAYALPVAVLILILAIGTRLALQPKRRLRAAACFVAAVCLFNAGFSPMYLAFQGAVLSVLLLGAMFFLRDVHRAALPHVARLWAGYRPRPPRSS